MKHPITPESWNEIRSVVNDAFRASFHYAIASVGPDGDPHVSPIGSLLLWEPGKATYFEIFTSQLPKNLRRDNRICIQAVSCGPLFWAGALLRGKFPRPPGIRLHGRVVGDRRPPTELELARWRGRVGLFRHSRGYAILWKRLDHVRDVELDSFEWIRLGRMTDVPA